MNALSKFKLLLILSFFVLVSCGCNKKRLAEPQVIQTFPCKDFAHYDKDSNLVMFNLSRDHEIRGNMIPESSTIEFQGNNVLIYLSKPTEIQGYLIRERKHTNDHCVIDQDGKLVFFVPQEDLIIKGIPCKGQEDVNLYGNGDLMRCYLYEDHVIDNISYKAGSYLHFDKEGKVQKY